MAGRREGSGYYAAAAVTVVVALFVVVVAFVLAILQSTLRVINAKC